MKRYLYILLSVLCLVAVSCGKTQRTLYDGPDYIMFSDTLYVFGVVDDKECFEIPVCATKVSDKDRNIGVEVMVKEGNAIYGNQFKLESSTVVLPAGELTTNVLLKGIADNIEINSDVEVVLRLMIPEENVWTDYGTKTRVQLTRCCPYSRDSFVGYMKMSSSYALSYMVDYRRLFRAEADPEDENGLILKDFMYDGYDVKVHLCPEDRLNPVIEFDEQIFAATDIAFGTKYGEGYIMMVQPSGYASFYSTCENFLALYTTLYVPNVGTVGIFTHVCERISDGEAERIMNEGF
ncbi:MAG: DUF4984 domain-containing protein [Bacteroidales bacterium]|nr:DUF4984 domain-containing protein [Bacteroidales bacterium]